QKWRQVFLECPAVGGIDPLGHLHDSDAVNTFRIQQHVRLFSVWPFTLSQSVEHLAGKTAIILKFFNTAALPLTLLDLTKFSLSPAAGRSAHNSQQARRPSWRNREAARDHRRRHRLNRFYRVGPRRGNRNIREYGDP